MTSPLADLPITFIGSFPDPAIQLDPPLPEFAFAGRSNVGKSSLLNALTGKPGLARVSGTPGKTAFLNVFRAPDLYLVDLPGYGYARASKTERHRLSKLVDAYLSRRDTLAGIVWLLDIRRDPSEDDIALQAMMAHSGRPALVVLTKMDKLTHSQVAPRVRALAAALTLHEDQVQPVSSRTGAGIADLGESLLAAARSFA
ncbi:MAG TPA: ribosome biogenesis GTP-binding protein YihA/YsxC [Gemmatimonadales bacterium]|nr:ribosome biogenesis GTP-binding protein YihA/YsxC [Gemmatimonadales bacterium]